MARCRLERGLVHAGVAQPDLQHTFLGEHETGERAAVHAARVDADFVRPIDDDAPVRRVAEDDGGAEVVGPVEEIFADPEQVLVGLFAEKKPYRLYVDRNEQQFWQRVRQSPSRTAREVRAQFRDIDRRLAEVEAYYVSSNPGLSAEIEKLR